jgi:hypothetical protein
MGATFNQRGWSNREVRVRRNELLDVLAKNRRNHIAQYIEACQGYRAAAIKALDEVFTEARNRISNLKAGKMISVVGFTIPLHPPENHERSYDQIIRMMEMEVDDVVTLTADQFACFVMDDWEWSEHWAASNRAYLSQK